MDYRALGQRIKEHRKHFMLTQKQVASVAGMSISFYGHIERGTRVASIATLLTIAHILETTPDVLLGLDDDYDELLSHKIMECVDSMRSFMDQIEVYCATGSSRKKRTRARTGERA